ncbi:hypothetical protein SAMN04487983_1001480 [Streptomyces sp. yr375]|nr:hypothetical protein SAMN04487983_1001480 [Streptomyces sp. yr375]
MRLPARRTRRTRRSHRGRRSRSRFCRCLRCARWWRGRPAQHAGVGQQRGARGADFAECPDLADRRIVPQDEDHRARAGDPGVLVQRAPLTAARAGRVVTHGRGPGVRARVRLGEAAQGRDVTGARRHRARRGAGDRRRTVPVSDHTDRPGAARTAGRGGVRVHKSQSTCPSWRRNRGSRAERGEQRKVRAGEGRAIGGWGTVRGWFRRGPPEMTSFTACPWPRGPFALCPLWRTSRLLRGLSVRTPKLPP